MGSTHSSTRLIINADDLGISRGVNTGIIEAANAGVVTSASMLVNLPAFADAVERVRPSRGLSIGLHLNFTLGRPLATVTSLTARSGEFYSLPVLLARASIGLVDSKDVARECLAQIDRLTEAGFTPTHLDSHRHVHIHPAISAAVLHTAASRGIFQVRIPWEPMLTNAGDWRATLKKAGLLVCARLSGRTADAGQRNHFFGLSLQGRVSFAKRLFALLRQLPPGTSELMIHPGYADASLAELDGYTGQRETELKILCSREFQNALLRNRVRLTNFAELQSSGSREHQLAQHH